uniref:Reverse transcriptase zinc-binding domain-containing protein n=1 Tax=Tanacetum cinerariifolium TaxID=118510 RepID=A0A6L2KSS3_TANCI|nr:reverse transcriptase zinc-binding domain-containing protein [Tanacetum cinerariifolium]
MARTNIRLFGNGGRSGDELFKVIFESVGSKLMGLKLKVTSNVINAADEWKFPIDGYLWDECLKDRWPIRIVERLGFKCSGPWKAGEVSSEEIKAAFFDIEDDKPLDHHLQVFQVILGDCCKVITNRIKVVLNGIIDANQSAFIEGRQIYDNIMLAQELREMRTMNSCFVEDLMMFFHGDVKSASVLRREIDEFCLSFGLRPSMAKSTMYFGNVTNEIKRYIKMVMPFNEGYLPVKYLKIPLDADKIARSDFTILLDKVPKINHEVEDKVVWVNKKGKVKDLCVNEVWNGIRNSSAKRLVWGAVAYFIWQERNVRIFRNGGRFGDELFKVIFESVRYKLMSLKLKTTPDVIKAAEVWNIPINRMHKYRKIPDKLMTDAIELDDNN